MAGNTECGRSKVSDLFLLLFALPRPNIEQNEKDAGANASETVSTESFARSQ